MYQPATARDIEEMKKLVEKSQSKAIKSCLKINTQRDETKNQSRHHHNDPSPRRVEFRRTRTEREYEYDYHDKSRKWYNKKDYAGFAAGGRLDVMKYQTIQNEKNSWTGTPRIPSIWRNDPHNVQHMEDTSFSSCCIRGLEQNLSPSLERQRQRRRYLLVEAVLNEQWEQDDAGTFSWDRIAQVSRKHTLICQQQAVERARLDIPLEISTNIAANAQEDDKNSTPSLLATTRKRSHHFGGRPITTRDKSAFTYASGSYQRELAWIWWSSSSPDSTCSASSSWSSLLFHLTPHSWFPAGGLPPVRRRA